MKCKLSSLIMIISFLFGGFISNNQIKVNATTVNLDTYYKNVSNLGKDELLDGLAELTAKNHTYYTKYSECKEMCHKSDVDPNDSTKTIGFYSRLSLQGEWSSGGTIWNREHVWCQSLSNGLYPNTSESTKGAGGDIHHIRPEASKINNNGRNDKKMTDRNYAKNANWSEYIYDNNGTPYHMDTYTATDKWEPSNQVKGDTARILMYLYMHYSSDVSSKYNVEYATSELNIEDICYTDVGDENTAWEMLLKWNEIDPVDDFERSRNNYCASVTGTRNPFVDHPEYASMIWGDGKYEGDNDGGGDNNDQPITPDKEDANLDELSSLINKHFNNGYYVKDTKIDLTESSIKELLDLDEGFHNKATYLDLTTYFTPEELWMTNEKGVNSGYGTDENGNMTHFILSDNEEKIIDYVVEKGQFNWVNPNEDGMEGYYLTLKDLKVTSNQNWKVSNGVYESNDKDVIDLFKAVCAPCYKGFKNDLSNYITFDRVEIEEVNKTLELRLYANEVDAYKVNSGDNLFAKAIITKNTSNELKEVELTLSCTIKTNRVSYSSTQQVWKQNGINLINDKASSTSNVPDFKDTITAKFYKGSKVTIYLDNDMEFNKIVFTCNKTSYANVLYNSITSTTGVTVSKNSKVVTVTFANNVSEFVISSISEATWVDSIVVTSLQ